MQIKRTADLSGEIRGFLLVLRSVCSSAVPADLGTGTGLSAECDEPWKTYLKGFSSDLCGTAAEAVPFVQVFRSFLSAPSLSGRSLAAWPTGRVVRHA